MSYLVLARKWRPQKFDEVVGQQHITRTLANAIAMDRVAHAFRLQFCRAECPDRAGCGLAQHIERMPSSAEAEARLRRAAGL